MRALQREAASKQRTGRDWIGGVAVVGTAAAAAALALAALRRQRRGAAGGADIPSDPSGASGVRARRAAREALSAARDAMNEAKLEMIEVSGACLRALTVYASRLGEHTAYDEYSQKQPSLRDAWKVAKAELEEATNAFNALVDLEADAGGKYTERVREYSIALANVKILMPTAHTDSESAETHDTSGQEGDGLEEHTGDAGGETDTRREVRAKERVMRQAHKKHVDARLNTARLRGEKQALWANRGGEVYEAKRAELEEAKNEQEIAAKKLEASDVEYARAVKETMIQRLQREAPQSKVPGFAPLLAGAASAVNSIFSRKTIEGHAVSDSSGWGRARPARERRPVRATRRFL